MSPAPAPGRRPTPSGPGQRLRRRLRAQRERMRRLGLRGFLRIEQATLRRLFKATLAAMLAWEAADLLHSPKPALASLAAILVVQVTVRATLARSIQLTIGVTAGLVLSVALGEFLGLHWWTIGLIVLGGLVVGELLRLGPFASQAAISALLAFSLGSAYGILRIVDTIVGALVGVAVNALIVPPSYVAETAATLRRVAEDLGDLLVDIGDGLGEEVHSDDPTRWLDRARAVASDLHAAADSLEQAEESVHFNPLTRASDDHLYRLGEARLALEHASSQVRGMARALGDLVSSIDGGAAEEGPSDTDHPDTDHPDTDHPDAAVLGRVFRQLGPPLAEVGHAVAAFGRLQEDPTSVPNREQAVRAGIEATSGQHAAADAVTDLSQHGELAPAHLLLVSSVLVDVERLIHEVDVQHGSHTAAVTAAP
jgi:uncharacterized membrane protein YccC